MSQWMHECVNDWMFECMNVWMHECLNAWMSECMIEWMAWKTGSFTISFNELNAECMNESECIKDRMHSPCHSLSKCIKV